MYVGWERQPPRQRRASSACFRFLSGPWHRGVWADRVECHRAPVIGGRGRLVSSRVIESLR